MVNRVKDNQCIQGHLLTLGFRVPYKNYQVYFFDKVGYSFLDIEGVESTCAAGILK